MPDGGSSLSGYGWPEKRRCPHALVQHCPLYAASHHFGTNVPPHYGCCWGDFAIGCAVDRKEIDYSREVARLCETLDGAELVAESARVEREAEAKAQRERNMRAAGIR